jgi:hypothetical protein
MITHILRVAFLAQCGRSTAAGWAGVGGFLSVGRCSACAEASDNPTFKLTVAQWGPAGLRIPSRSTSFRFPASPPLTRIDTRPERWIATPACVAAMTSKS